MNRFYFSLYFLLLPLIGLSQEESEACLPPSKKVLKLIDAGNNAKDASSAVTNFKAAIEMDESNAMAYYEYAVYAYTKGVEYYDTYPNPAKGDKSFQTAETLFQQTLDACPDYHANCFYFLGVINYKQDDMATAVDWFKKFKAFRHSDVSRYSEDHSKMLSDVENVISKYEKEQSVKENAVPFHPVIVKNVSTSDQEYFPMISPDNELIFYTRKLDARNYGDLRSNIVEQLTVSKRPDMHSDFDGGTKLPDPFNNGSVQSYGATTLAVDNKEMILCACKQETVYGQPYMNCDLYRTTYVLEEVAGKKKYKWAPLENMGPKINTPDGWEGQPSLSSDGQTLFYTVNRPTSRNNDIYIVERNEDGTWGDPRPFDEINTDGKDKSPFLHQDSETLYFVSQVTEDRPGVGGLDIYYIRKEGDKWTEPKNIGFPINSEADELGLFVSIDGTLAYFSSYVKGVWNIYSFELYQEARPQKVALLKGELKDDNGQPVKDAKIEIAYEGNDEVTEIKVNGDDGKYAAIVKTKDKQDVMVTVKKEGHAFDTKLIAKEELDKKDVVIRGKDLEVKELKVGSAYTINDILYGTNSYVLSDRSKFILKGFARFLKENPSISVSIQGHTDDVGDDNENLLLSDKRAHGVKDYLVSLGIEENRLKAKGYGETVPKVPNTSSSNRAKNRRTDFIIDGM